IDHSVQVDAFGTPAAFRVNVEREFERNRERYAFLRWGQHAFRNFRVVPPDTGIVHQVNLEYLAQVVCRRTRDGHTEAFPDTVLGTDSHTTMVNGLGVDARTADGHARAPGGGLPPRGHARPGGHRDRRRAHGHRDAAQARRGG